MRKVLVSGCNGHMGQIVCRMIEGDPDMRVVCGVDVNTTPNQIFPVYDLVNLVLEEPDVIIDFSSAAAVKELLEFAQCHSCPIVIATTGLSDEVLSQMREVSQSVPVFRSANMSYDICVLQRILEVAVPLLKSADIEISEQHHRRKADSPSGTAKMLADTINDALETKRTIIYGRSGKRQEEEIGISSVRGGNVCGTHTIHFFGENDTLEITHIAHSRDGFAEGAIRAAKFITSEGITPGLYTMKDLF